MPDFAVSIAIRGEDHMSDNLRRLSHRVDRFGRGASKSFGMASRAAGMFKSVLGGVLAASGITAGFTALSMGIGAATRGFVDMDQALTSAGAKFQLSKLGAEQAAQAMTQLNAAARKTGADTEFTATQAAQGLEFLAMAGFTAEQAVAALPAMVDLATASNTDLARASDIASDALGAFGLASSDAATQAANLTRINDVFAQTTASANVDMENLFETFKMGAPIMTTAGQSLESFAAMTAAMGNAGIKGSLAGTTLKNTIQRLVAPVGAAEKQLKKLNIRVEDQHGNMRDVAAILEDFADATKNMGNAQRTAAISTVFGMRAVSGISTILDKGIPTLRQFRSGLENAGGASKRMADEMRGSLINRLKTLQSSLMEAGFRIIEAFQEKFPGAIDAAIEAIRGFDVAPIVDGIRTAITWIKNIYGWVVKWKWAIVALGIAIGAFKVALALTGAVEAVIAVIKGATTVTQLWTGSQWALNIAMLANPITLIIALIVALIAVVALVIIYWDDLKKVWLDTMNSVYDGTNETVNAVVDAMTSMVTPIMNVGIDVINAFGRVWHSIKSGVASAVKFAINAVAKLQNALGVQIFDLPSSGDIDRWFGVDKEYEPMQHATEDQVRQAYQDAYKGLAEFLGADTNRKAPVEAPNKARVEAQQQSVDFRGQVDIFTPQGFAAEMTSSSATINGQKAPGVNWKAKSGRNSGA